MSNHSGGRMLNEVIHLLVKEYRIFDSIGKDNIQQLINDIVTVGESYDCNESEIMCDIVDIVNKYYEENQ